MRHTLDSHLHRGVLHVLFEAMSFDSCTRARKAIKWQRHYRRRTKLDLTFSLGVGRKIVCGVGVGWGGGGGGYFKRPPDTRQNKLHENNQMQSGEKELLYDTVLAGSTLPSGHSACHAPRWQECQSCRNGKQPS